jgi:hypothetical protein
MAGSVYPHAPADLLRGVSEHLYDTVNVMCGSSVPRRRRARRWRAQRPLRDVFQQKYRLARV